MRFRKVTIAVATFAIVFASLAANVSSAAPSSRPVYLALGDSLAASIQANGDLRTRAEENTRAMVTSLLGSLGFTSVTVRFE